MPFVASGGSGEGFTWAVAGTAGGTIDGEGVYVAGKTGEDVVTATDSLGNAGSATVRVSGQPLFSRFPPVSGWSCGCQTASLDRALLAGLAWALGMRRRPRARRSRSSGSPGVALVLAVVVAASVAQAAAKKPKGAKKSGPTKATPTKTAPTPAPAPAADPAPAATPSPPAPPPTPAPTPAPAPPRSTRPSLAVVDVDVSVKGETLDAAAFSYLLVAAADGVDRFRVISSKDITAVLGLERQRQLLGCSEDSSCMTEIASALGAEFLLVASVGKVGENYLVSTRLMDTRSARAVGRGSAQVTEPSALFSALWTAAEQTFDAWGTTLPPEEAARWSSRVRPAPPATVTAPARTSLSFGATVGAVGGWQLLSVPGQRGSVGVQVDGTLRVARFDLAAGLIIGPNLGARLTATLAFIAQRFRAMAGVRGTTYPGLMLFGGGPVLSAEFAFTPWLAASAVGGADLFPTRSGLVAVLLGNVGVAMHF